MLNVCLLGDNSNLHFCRPQYEVYAWPTEWVGYPYHLPTPE